MRLRAGDTIERYTILGLLGEGGMGQVYRARDTRLQRIVALKVLHEDEPGGAPDALSTGGGLRILREARAAAALDHPNVVAIHDVGETELPGGEKVAYLAMELVKGKPLRALVGDASVPMDERVRMLADVARALQAAHAIGLVHRDIKPENVMIRDDGAVKVLDFGIARRAYALVDPTSTTEAQILSSLSTVGGKVGTPYYMAPEQMRGEALDGRADQFAWAVMGYELLSGKPTWGARIDSLQLVSAVLTKNPDPLDRVEPRVPPHVARAIARAMEKSPEGRFASMREAIAALEGARPSDASPLAQSVLDANLPIPTPPPEPAKRAPRSRAWLLALPLGALVAGAVVASRAFHPPTTNRADAAPPPRCTASGCTSSMKEPARCREDGTCVRLASEDCEVRADEAAVQSDDTVWIGTMFPKELEPDTIAADLARQDFVQMMSGFARAHDEAHVHPIALVTCDDSKDVMRATRHLVDDVRVPAVIGFASAAEIIDVGSSLLIPRGVLTIASEVTSPLVTSLPNRAGQPRLVWRTTYSSAETAKAFGVIVPEVIEPQVRASGLGASAPMRVALVRGKVRGGSTFDEILFNAIRFNGKSALENGPNYRTFVLSDDPPAREKELAALTQFRPHVVIPMLDSSAALSMLDRLESSRPRYVFFGYVDGPVVRWAEKSTERRARFFAVQSVSTTSINARFVMHYNELADRPITTTDAPNSTYDAFYLLAYAVYASGGQPITGAMLARSVSQLVPPGKSIDVGPASIFDAYATLRSGDRIDLNGATGSLDFDLKTGEAPFDQALICLAKGTSGKLENVESGIVFHAATKRLGGTFACP